jgi:hypothetical protein
MRCKTLPPLLAPGIPEMRLAFRFLQRIPDLLFTLPVTLRRKIPLFATQPSPLQPKFILDTGNLRLYSE